MDQGESTTTVDCGVCVNLRKQIRTAVEECNRSNETDARVLLRRHTREQHGTELPYPQSVPGGMS